MLQDTAAESGSTPRRLAALLVALGSLLVGAAVPAATAEPSLSEAAGWLRDYLRIDTSNPPGSEHRGAAYLAHLLHRERIPTRLLVSPTGRVSLYARLEAAEPAGGPLILTHHIDVVAGGPGWQLEPFSGAVEEGVLWGRGALDAKGLGIAHLAAFIELARRRVPLARDIVFLAVADEEAGGGEGMEWLIDSHPELLGDAWAVLNEGGAGRVVAGRLLWWDVEVAQKRPLWLELRSHGKGGHGSSHATGSAPHRLVGALARLVERPPVYRVTDEARRYTAALAPIHSGEHRRVLADIDRWVDADRPPPLLPGFWSLFVDSLQVTVVEAGEKINVIPAEARARVDVRLLPDTDEEAYLDEVRTLAGRGIEVEVLVSSPPVPPSPTDHPAFAAIREVLGESAPVAPSLIAGFTDSRFFRQRGIPAYGLSPFHLDGLARSGVHAVDEKIPLAAFDDGVERMRRLVEACVGR